MKEHPIIFTNDHVEAILEGRKTQTRRVVPVTGGFFSAKGFSFYLPALLESNVAQDHSVIKAFMDLCPYGKPGDKLWVREKFVTESGFPKPAIHMPRAKSRATLVVKNVSVERLNSITGKDCIAEGVLPNATLGARGKHIYIDEGAMAILSAHSAREEYRRIWDSINKGAASWVNNPWVWVIEFELASS